MAEFQTMPCEECGAMVMLNKIAAHRDEHNALIEVLRLLLDSIWHQNAAIDDLYRRLNGERPA